MPLAGLAQREQPIAVVEPAPGFTPDDVVALQMRALSDAAHNPQRIEQVYALASPANKRFVGSVARFEQMLIREPYRALLQSKTWIAGEAVIKDDRATVLVTVIDPQERARQFRFVLSRQQAPFSDCWMTDGVFLASREADGGQRPPGGQHEERAVP